MSDIWCQAKKAYVCDFKLAADLYQEAIDAGPPMREVHVDHTFVLVKIDMCSGMCSPSAQWLEVTDSGAEISLRFDGRGGLHRIG